MRKSELLTMMLVGLVLGACAVAGCKGEGGIRRYVPGFLKKKAAPAPPTEESFRRAADEYFVRNGYEKVADGRYRKFDEKLQGYRTHVLEWEPTRIIEYSHSIYRCQGIVGRKIISQVGRKDEIKEAPFIMYWNGRKNRWEHLFGRDIPQPGE